MFYDWNIWNVAMETKLVNLVPLNGTNYATWKLQYKIALIRDGLWNIVNETEIIPNSGRNYSFVWWRFVLTDLFRFHQSKWISDVTGTNTVFDIEVRNGKLGPFWRRFRREWTAQKGVSCLIVENHVVWRNFPLNRKISNGWLKAWWSSIRFSLSIA